MNKFLWICAALMGLFVMGESLTCNTCTVGITGKCLFTSTETCDNSTPHCYWGELVFNISSLVRVQLRGCLDTARCNQTETDSLLTTGYTITRTCCSTDRCNGATSLQLHLTAALGTALMIVWSTWSQ
ncbi:lymphocyte antigen-6, epidermis [Scomber scombrus]|uniref:lymphocyte antigen-6, epidermis n=1 Tax=Scomber scombrus TaxID=13677 RepID=UPI002DDA6D40|nr:lymphocyte antigen-6, epidermis [Scomber scombrus]